MMATSNLNRRLFGEERTKQLEKTQETFNLPKSQAQNIPAPTKSTRSSGGGGGGSSSSNPLNLPAPNQVTQELIEKPVVKSPQQPNTIKAQLEKTKAQGLQPGQKEITLPSSSREYGTNYYRQSFGSAFVQSAMNVGSNVKTFVTGRPGDEYKSVSKPFDYVFQKKYEKEAYRKIKTGSISPGENPFEVTTFGNIQDEIELKRNLAIGVSEKKIEKELKTERDKLQSKVDTGEISVETAREQLDKIQTEKNKQFVKQQEKAFSQNPDVSGVYERTMSGKKAVGLATDLIATSGSVVVGAFNPVAGASVATAYFTAKGIKQGTAKPTFQEIREQGGIFGGVTKKESGGFELLQPSKLDVEYKELRKEAGMNLLIGATSGVGLVGARSKDILKGELSELGGKVTITKSKIYDKGGKSYISIEGIQTKGELKRTVNIVGVGQKEGKNFVIASGKGYSLTSGQFDFLGYKGFRSPTYYGGFDTFEVGAKGLSVPTQKGSFFLGTGTIIPQSSAGKVFKSFTPSLKADIGDTIRFGGKVSKDWYYGASQKVASTEKADFYKSVGGKIKNKKISIDFFGFDKVFRGSGSTSSSSGSTFFQTKTSTKPSSVLASQLGDVARVSAKQQTRNINKATGSILNPTQVFNTKIEQRTITRSLSKSQLMDRNVLDVRDVSVGRIAPVLKPVTRTKTSGRYRGVSIITPVSKPLTTSRTTQTSALMFKSKQGLRTKQVQVLQPVQPVKPLGSLGRPSFDFGFGGGLPPVFAPTLSLGGGKKKRSQGARQPTKYQSSFTARVFGIRGKSQLLSKSAGYNPLQIRGIEVKGKKRKKKKT